MAGREVTVIEDVVTSGGQIVLSTRDLRALGATVNVAVCAIDREEGGAEALAAEGIALRAALTGNPAPRRRLSPPRSHRELRVQSVQNGTVYAAHSLGSGARQPNSTPWASGRSAEKLMVLVARRM